VLYQHSATTSGLGLVLRPIIIIGLRVSRNSAPGKLLTGSLQDSIIVCLAFFRFPRTPSSAITPRHSTRFCRTFRSESDLKKLSKILSFLLYNEGFKNSLFSGVFTTTYQRKYILNETSYRNTEMSF